LEQSITH